MKNFQSQKNPYNHVLHDKGLNQKQKKSVSKEFFDKSFLDIFFVHFWKIKILFIFQKSFTSLHV